MPAKFDVIVCGSLHLDIIVTAPALPRIDETAVGSGWKKRCGGKGGNQAVQAANAGASTAMIGRIGRDEFGDALTKNLHAAGVDTSCLKVDPLQGSGMSVAILQDDGDYGAVIVTGANATMDPASIEGQWGKLGGAKILLLQNEVPHAVNVAAATVARGSGTQVVFNAAPMRDLGDDLLRHVDVLVVNRVEAEAMCGMPVYDRATARLAIEKLTNGIHSVIITLGGDGLVVAARDQPVFEIEPIAVHVTSTHGAGDCFVGTLAAQLAASFSLQDACSIANQRAAAFVSQLQ